MNLIEALKKHKWVQRPEDSPNAFYGFDDTGEFMRLVQREKHIEAVRIIPTSTLLLAEDYAPYKKPYLKLVEDVPTKQD